MADADDLNHTLSWTDTIAHLHDFQSRLLLAIHGIPEAHLRRIESSGRWSILDVIGHLSDLELLTALRVRMMLAYDHPALPAFDQNEFVRSVHQRESLAHAIEDFGAQRRSNLALVERLRESELARDGEHPEFGPLTIRQIFARVQRHQEQHLAQIERIKTTLRLRASAKPDLSGVVAAHVSTASVRSISPGIRVRDLWRNGVKRALQVELDAGTKWPGLDYHVPGPEEVYVVDGDFDDGANVYGPGSFLHHPAGSSHSPTTKSGCTLFVFYPEG